MKTTASADIEIIGAGIFGLATAFACAKRGAKVRVIEQCKIGSGASGGILGALAPHTPEAWNSKKQFQLDSLLMAEEWWREAQIIGRMDPEFERCGRVQPIANERALMLAQKRANAAKLRWGDLAEWTIETADTHWAPVSSSGLVIRDTLSARIAPRKALQCLAVAIEALDGQIIEQSSHPQGADLTIHTTGFAGLAALGELVGHDVGCGEKGQAALLAYQAGDKPQIYSDGIYAVPHRGGHVAIGSTSERHFENAEVSGPVINSMITRVKTEIPALRNAPVVATWAGIRPRSATRAPILGPFPGRSGHFIANGGFKIGFGLAPKVGEVMADLVLQSKDEIPVELHPEAVMKINH